MSERVQTFRDYSGDLRLSCDVLVVGSGPTGAAAAKTLAEARQGRDHRRRRAEVFAGRLHSPTPHFSMGRMMRESGLRATRGNIFMPTLQAIGLGGG